MERDSYKELDRRVRLLAYRELENIDKGSRSEATLDDLIEIVAEEFPQIHNSAYVAGAVAETYFAGYIHSSLNNKDIRRKHRKPVRQSLKTGLIPNGRSEKP